MRPRTFTILLIAGALGGLFFNGFATFDFVQHLDRQVHGIHCSFVPGLEAADLSGESGCAATLMSPYSSVFRKSLWGGVPMSLLGMGVFAYLLFRGLDLVLNRKQGDPGATLWLVAATALPVLTSIVMGYLSFAKLDAACKLCIGVYASSALGFIGAVGAWRAAVKGSAADPADDPAYNPDAQELEGHLLAFGQGLGFVAVPLVAYVGLMPDYSGYPGSCGKLTKPEDTGRVMIDLDGSGSAAIEVFDPLCPTCKAFEGRIAASGVPLDRKLVLFPLDRTCNWNVGKSLHAGACTVSEAVICAEGRATEVIDWAFANQDAIRVAAEADPEAARTMVVEKFPDLKSCVGSARARQALNKSMRWVVANQLPVMTPQLFVDGTKLCDEDIDLGLDYALSRMVKSS